MVRYKVALRTETLLRIWVRFSHPTTMIISHNQQLLYETTSLSSVASLTGVSGKWRVTLDIPYKEKWVVDSSTISYSSDP